MRWVKCSEQLPGEKNKSIPAKNDGKYGVLTRFDNFIEFSGRGFFQTFHDRNTPDYKSLEYLDESPSPVAPVGDDLTLEAMDFYWRHLTDKLTQKDLGDIERRNYEAITTKLYKRITNPSPVSGVSDAVAFAENEVIGLLTFMTIEDIREGKNGRLRKYFTPNGECVAQSYKDLYEYYKNNRPISQSPTGKKEGQEDDKADYWR